MADRYWVGGTGTWSSTNTANWSASSGGATGASVPTAADNVFFDANSNVGTGAFTVTMANTPRVCNDITISGLDGTMTLAGTSIGLTVSGSLSFPATNFTRSYTGTTTFNATTTGKTITTNGVAFGAGVTLDGVGGEWILGSAFSCGSSTLTVTNGTFDTSTSNYAVTAGLFSSSNSNTRTIKLNNSIVTLSGSFSCAFTINLTFNAGQSQILLTGGTSGISGALTFYDVRFNMPASGSAVNSITGASTFTNLTFVRTAAATHRKVSISNDLTITGTFSFTGGASAPNCRQAFESSIATSRILTIAAASGINYVDFFGITIAGAVGTLSGTSFGDAGLNSNITFSTPKTVYLVSTATAQFTSASYALSSGGSGSLSNMPLPQDTLIIDNNGFPSGASFVFTNSCNVCAIDATNRTLPWTLTAGSLGDESSPDIPISGNWILNSGVTVNRASSPRFLWRKPSILDLDTGGNTFDVSMRIDCFANSGSGGLRLINNTLTCTQTFNIRYGHFNFSDRTVNIATWDSGTFSAAQKVLTFGSTGQINITGTSTAFTCNNVHTFVGTSRTVNITSTGSTSITVVAGSSSEATSFDFNFTGGTYALFFLNAVGNTARNVNFTGYAGTWQQNSSTTIYGDLTLSTGMTLSASSNALTFGATSGTKTITSNGKTMDFPVTFNGVGGTWQLQDAMTLGSTRTGTLTNGTLDLNEKTLTVGTRFTTATGTKNLTFNGGTLVCPDPNTTSFNNAAPTNFTTTAGTGTGIISMTAATAKTFVGGGSTYNCTLNQGGAGTLTITGANTFNNVTNTNATASQITFPASTTTTVNNFTLSGSLGNLVSLRSSTPGTRFTLSDASGTVSVSYLNIQDSNAIGGANWISFVNLGNVNSGNNVGWQFLNPVSKISIISV
jgi:hypothetical protein